MTTIIMRSALIAHGHNPPPDVARIEIDHTGRRVITWDDVMRDRRERQAAKLAVKRAPAPAYRPHRVWVAWFGTGLMGGWQAFIGDHRGNNWDVWIDRDRRWLIPDLLNLFPLAAMLGDENRRWETWKEAFSRVCRRGSHLGRPRGCAFVWWDGQGEPRLTREGTVAP